MIKIMFLGGSFSQLAPIKYAKEKGYYTILCDFLTDNPGRNIADLFYCVSTTDKDSILALALKEKINGIVSYSSDPAAKVAAYVAEKLNLPTNHYNSVLTLSEKDRFRSFLKKNGFNLPLAIGVKSFEEVKLSKKELSFPLIVKPVDSSGSKGVSKVDKFSQMEDAVIHALSYSSKKAVIIEELITTNRDFIVECECFVIDGSVKFWGFLDSKRSNELNPYIPIGYIYPTSLENEIVNVIKKHIESVFELLDIQFGAFNIELILDSYETPYILEIGPRNGGNMIPELMKMTAGVDMIAATVETSLGFKYEFSNTNCIEYSSIFVLHSNVSGVFRDIIFSENIRDNITRIEIFKKKGELIEVFETANKSIGLVFLRFKNRPQQIEFFKRHREYIKIIIEE